MHEVLVNRLGGLTLPRKSVVGLTDRPDMTIDVYRGRKKQCNNNKSSIWSYHFSEIMPQCPGIGIFLSRYPYSFRDLILNKRASKDARLTPR